MAAARGGSSLVKLLRLGGAALLPSKTADGVWHKAAVSAKAAARLRKAALLEGRCVGGSPSLCAPRSRAHAPPQGVAG